MSAAANEQISHIRCDGERGYMSWHQALSRQLVDAYSAQKLPHALIFAGPQFLGKTHFARQFAQFLMCSEPLDSVACGQCKSCLLSAAGTHPDWINVEPELPRKILKIDTIRQVQIKLQQTAQQGGNKVCILGPAEQMNDNAANALLKMLEEPPANTYFLLYTHQAKKLLPTILSRCQRVSFVIPTADEIIKWLSSDYSEAKILDAITRGRGFPGKVLECLNSEVDTDSDRKLLTALFSGAETAQNLSQQIDSASLPDFLDGFLGLINDCAKNQQLGSSGRDGLTLLMALPATAIHEMYSAIASAKSALTQNANPRLLTESLLLQCLAIYGEFNS